MSIISTPLSHAARPIFALVLAIWLSALAAPARADTADPARVEALFDLIGISALVRDTRDTIQEMAGQGALPPGAMAARWQEAAERHFDPETLHHRFVTDTARLMSAREVAELIEIFSTDFALRISGLETLQQTSYDNATRSREGQEILARLWRENPDRVEDYQDMLKILNTVDDTLEQAMKINFIMLRTIVGAGLLGGELDDGEIVALLASQEDKMRHEIRLNILARSAHTYDTLSDEDMARYMAILKQPVVLGLYESVGEASQALMLDEFEAFAETLAELSAAEEL